MQSSKILDKYKIINKIASGGMGEILLAYKYKLDEQGQPIKNEEGFIEIDNSKKYAVKRLLNKGDIRSIQSNEIRFKREIESLISLKDLENVSKIIDYQYDNYSKSIVLEFVEGQSLKKIIEQADINKKPITIEQKLNYIITIIDALSKIHKLGIIHRDIKPDNIMITTENIVKILDFGIVYREEDIQLTQDGSAIGSPKYVAPEIFGYRAPNTPKTFENLKKPTIDIFSIGAILYEMLEYKTPFEKENGESLQTIMLNIINNPVNEMKSDVHWYLKKVIMKSISKDYKERYQNCEDFKKDLQKFVDTNYGKNMKFLDRFKKL